MDQWKGFGIIGRYIVPLGVLFPFGEWQPQVLSFIEAHRHPKIPRLVATVSRWRCENLDEYQHDDAEGEACAV
jgi:hypothetical protein